MASSVQSTTHYIGVDVSGAKLHAALVAEDGRVVERREATLEREAITTQVARTVAELRDRAPNIAALGIGIPGLVNRQTDRVLVSTDLPSIVRGDIHSEL
ncbi:MAG: ROK family protein, partial [Pyrinomonadaceae bacterium]|nr:ROK family protein [Pyrinomonadaceae bacterium]